MYGVTAAICSALIMACAGVKTGELWGLGSELSPEGLYTIDLDTGRATLIQTLDLNPGEGALALSPGGVLYAAFSGAFDELAIIDRHTGEVTVVGPFGFADVSGLAFSPDGVLYGYDEGDDVLITVDVETGAGTEVGPIGFHGGGGGGGLAFAPDGTLFAVGNGYINRGDTTLWSVDLETGAATEIGPLGRYLDSASGLIFVGNQLYAEAREQLDDWGATAITLTIVDPATGSADMIGLLDASGNYGMGGLAFVPGPGDADRDGDVDLDDLAFFQGCLTGPLETEESLPLECLLLDFDRDHDIDLHDYAKFQAGFTGRDEANSFLELSDTQGQDNWYYGYYEPFEDPDGVYDASDFIQLPVYGVVEDTNRLCWALGLDSSVPWTRVCRLGGSASLPQEGSHWSIRRWSSELEGFVTITGHLSMEVGAYHYGDGILGHIFVDGAEVFSQFIEWDDEVGVEYEVTIDLAIGDPVDFAFEPLEDGYSDAVTFTSIISRLNPPDCNGNGVPDAQDIAEGTSADCNDNNIADECEPDCNNNGIPDSCDIGDGTSLDCTTNGVPDECEPDCNMNGSADSCEIASGVGEDCNLNTIPDECDINSGTSEDVYGNGIPDECEFFCAFETKLLAGDGEANDLFGKAVAVTGEIAVIGAPGRDEGASATGAVYVLRFNGVSWTQEQKLLATDGTAGDDFGFGIAIQGNAIVVGAPDHDVAGVIHSGAVYVFAHDGELWIEQQQLVASESQEHAHFGRYVDISDDTIAIGATGGLGNVPYSGAAYIFRHDGSTWLQEQKLVAADGETDDLFGGSVAIEGDVALIGADYDDNENGTNAGSAYVFRYNGSIWLEEQRLQVDGGSSDDHFGEAVALSDQVILIGARGDDDNHFNSGAAFVFRYHSDESGWELEQKLKAEDGTNYDEFGKSVALSGALALVGAPDDDEHGYEAGSAYLFEYDGAGWAQTRKFLGPLDGTHDEFGGAIAVSGTTALIGAKYDDELFDNAGTVSAFVDLLDEDCNDNGTADFCDIGDGSSEDANGDGVPDECEDVESCEGDANGDGTVDPMDTSFVLTRFECPVGGGDPDCDAANVNGDSVVDPLDVGFVLARFGRCD